MSAPASSLGVPKLEGRKTAALILFIYYYFTDTDTVSLSNTTDISGMLCSEQAGGGGGAPV